MSTVLDIYQHLSPPTHFYAPMIDIADNELAGGLMLSLLVQWTTNHLPCEKAVRDGLEWLVVPRQTWYEKLRLTGAKADARLNKLAVRGLIEKRVMKHSGKTMMHIAVNIKEIAEQVEALAKAYE